MSRAGSTDSPQAAVLGQRQGSSTNSDSQDTGTATTEERRQARKLHVASPQQKLAYAMRLCDLEHVQTFWVGFPSKVSCSFPNAFQAVRYYMTAFRLDKHSRDENGATAYPVDKFKDKPANCRSIKSSFD